MKEKTKVLAVLFMLITFSLSSAYIFLPNQFQSLDNRIRDFYFLFRGPEKTNENIVIVDIDERSIKELGQWPWERNKFAHILEILTQHGAGIIGLDIVFAEKDKTSPRLFAAQFGAKESEAEDYDFTLAKTISKTPTILGYQFDFEVNNTNNAPQIPAIFVEKHKSKMEFIPVAKGVLPNLSIIQNASYSSGYMNNIPDEAGMIRSVPLMIKYEDVLYPSLAFEMYRIASSANKVTISYSDAGVENVRLLKQSIKTDRFARLHINFRGPFKSYRYISAVDVFNNNITDTDVSGKFILIGTSAYGLMDLRSTPMDSVIAGVEVHANIIDNLLSNDMLFKPALEEIINLIIMTSIIFITIFIFSRFSMFFLIVSFFLSLSFLFTMNYYLLFHKHLILNSIFPLFSMILSLIAILGVKYIFEFRQKEMVKKSFSKKVSKQVMEDLLLNPQNTDLRAKEVETTIYFSDIRNFTTISENLKSPKRVTKFLNFYMNRMVLIIEKNKGTIDKFIGDAIMAYWNAPLEVENHADKAVLSALDQIAQRDNLNLTINKEFGFDVDYGIGINTGDVIVGEIGSEGRSDYSIIGDAVNLASRLEGLCKPYKVRLIISEFTKAQLTEEYVMQLLDIVQVKGKKEPVKIYEVIDIGKTSNDKQKEFDAYYKAHDFYISADFLIAKILFETLYKDYKKYLYKLYSERCEVLRENKILKFDGVYKFTTK
jgi:adenylate cyclase